MCYYYRQSTQGIVVVIFVSSSEFTVSFANTSQASTSPANTMQANILKPTLGGPTECLHLGPSSSRDLQRLTMCDVPGNEIKNKKPKVGGRFACPPLPQCADNSAMASLVHACQRQSGPREQCKEEARTLCIRRHGHKKAKSSCFPTIQATRNRRVA